MHAPPAPRLNPKPARITTWARLWLSCIAALLSCAAHLLPPAHRRRLPLLDLPRAALARHVARLIFLCALHRAVLPRACAGMREAGAIRALLRAGVQRHLTNTHGAYDLAAIARTCADPEAAIADMVAALEAGLTRRASILPSPASGALPALPDQAGLAMCDTS